MLKQNRSSPYYFFTHFIPALSCRRSAFCVEIFLVILFFTLSQPLFSAENKDDSYAIISIDNKFIINKASVENTLTIQDAKTQQQLKLIPVIDKLGKSSGIAGIHDASSRNSFIITLKDSPEIWEINYQTPSPAGFGKWVHNYRKDSGESTVSLFPIRQIRLKIPLDDFFFENNFVNVISVSCKGNVQIIDLDLGRRVAMFHLSEKNLDNKNPYKVKNLNHSFFSRIFTKASQFRLKKCDLKSS